MEYIERKYYINKIQPFISQNIIKVITGQRRVGKSYFLLQIIDKLKSINPKIQVIHINKELHKYKHIKTDDDLIRYIKSFKTSKAAILIDEIQEIENFENALRSLQAEQNYDIYCTGSNANLLSGELATFLSGRYIKIEIYPLSFLEFLEFNKLPNTHESLKLYMRYGGHPYIKHLELNDEIVFDYLKNIYQTILLKDIVSRNNIRNIRFLNDLSYFIADNIGNLVSAKKISDYLKSQKIKISNQAVLNYLYFLSDAFLVHSIKRYDIKGKRSFEIGEKYYFNDIGLRNSITGFKSDDIAKITENMIFNHLKMLGYEIKIGKFNDKEIDFVCVKQNKKMYIQATTYLNSKKEVEREFGNLLKIKDNFPKWVVSLDDIKLDSYNGIEHLTLKEFLSKEL